MISTLWWSITYFVFWKIVLVFHGPIITFFSRKNPTFCNPDLAYLLYGSHGEDDRVLKLDNQSSRAVWLGYFPINWFRRHWERVLRKIHIVIRFVRQKILAIYIESSFTCRRTQPIYTFIRLYSQENVPFFYSSLNPLFVLASPRVFTAVR